MKKPLNPAETGIIPQVKWHEKEKAQAFARQLLGILSKNITLAVAQQINRMMTLHK